MTRAVIEAKPRLIVKGERAFGPGKADLLEKIAATGSISAAAREMEMSYSRAWSLVETMNAAFKQPLVEAATGGRRGGGAEVTEAGLKVLALYRKMQAAVEKQTKDYSAPFSALLR
jgi:molybdate transport system regulatory protein